MSDPSVVLAQKFVNSYSHESLFQIRDSASISEVQRLSAALSAAMSRPQTRIGSMRFGG